MHLESIFHSAPVDSQMCMSCLKKKNKSAEPFVPILNPPLSPGVLVDVTQNYGSAFYSCAAGMALSALFLGLVKPAKRGLICGRRKSKLPQDAHERKENSEEQHGEHKLDTTERPHDCATAEVSSDHNSAAATRDAQEVICFA